LPTSHHDIEIPMKTHLQSTPFDSKNRTQTRRKNTGQICNLPLSRCEFDRNTNDNQFQFNFIARAISALEK
jgi:hypothetical protein